MRAFALRWLSGDERTLGLFLACGVLTMSFFRLDLLRAKLGVAPGPELPLALLLIAVALAWWSMLPRGFVWLEPAVLTWRDFGDLDRVRMISWRLWTGWLARQLVLGYLLALLAAIVAVPAAWVVAGAVVLVTAGALAFSVLRGIRHATREVTAVLALAVFAAVVRPDPVVMAFLALVLAAATVLTARAGRLVADAARPALVDGWRERVLRTSGLQFLDLALLLPAARPVRPRRLTRPTGLRLAWISVLGRARHVPTAVLLGLLAVVVHETFPAPPDVLVFTPLGYLAMVPLAAGLGDLWRSPGRRRWLGRSDIALRFDHLVVVTGLTAAWTAVVFVLGDWSPDVWVTVPVVAACVVRTMTRKPPTYDNLMPVDTPTGSLPVRLILQTFRGPDLALVAGVFHGTPWWSVSLVVTGVLAVAVFR